MKLKVDSVREPFGSFTLLAKRRTKENKTSKISANIGTQAYKAVDHGMKNATRWSDLRSSRENPAVFVLTST